MAVAALAWACIGQIDIIATAPGRIIAQGRTKVVQPVETGMVSAIAVNAAAMKKAAGSGHATATDLADWLVRTLGLPFREAHHVTGRAVALAEEKKVSLEKLSLEDLQSINPGITPDIFSVLAVQNSVKSRTSFGGTAPSEVRKQIRYWKKRLAKA